jgi:hypothetical protein
MKTNTSVESPGVTGKSETARSVSSLRRVWLLIPPVAVLIAAVPYGVRVRASRALGYTSDPAPVAASAPKTHSVASGAATSPPQQEEGFFIVVRPQGFEPKEVSGDAGRFLFAVDNRSGLDEVQFRLDRVAGERLKDVRVPTEKLDWRAFVDLTPGHYVLTEANHPEWHCDITVTAR